MNWYLSCAYAPEQKRCFHATARARLRKLAATLGFVPASYDLRNNQAGIAVSGEITLHHECVYVQVSQSAMGFDSGILIRRCRGRRDYVGERNHFAPLSLLDDIPALAGRVRAVVVADGGNLDGALRGRGQPGRGEPAGRQREQSAVLPIPALLDLSP